MKKIKICLAWHNLNSNNYGVGALAITQIALILDVANELNINVEIDLLGTSSAKDLQVKEQVENRFNVKLGHYDFSLKEYCKKILKFDLSILRIFNKYDIVMDIGEGDSFTDIYGMKRFILMSLTKLLVIFSNKKLILSPQTIGPFNRSISKLVAKYILSRCDAIFSRDYKSTELVTNMGIECVEVSDVAFTLPYDNNNVKIENSVGINISGLLWNGGYSKRNQFDLRVDYHEFIKKLIDEFKLRGKSVYLISHVIVDTMPVEDDYRVSLAIKALYSGDDSVIVAPRFSSPIEAKSYISQLEFFMGSRMHATIASLSSGVVTVPIAYSRKFSGVFGSLGYPFTLDAYNLDTNQLINKLFNYYDDQFDEMYMSMKSAREEALVRNKIYTKYLHEVLSDA